MVAGIYNGAVLYSDLLSLYEAQGDGWSYGYTEGKVAGNVAANIASMFIGVGEVKALVDAQKAFRLGEETAAAIPAAKLAEKAAELAKAMGGVANGIPLVDRLTEVYKRLGALGKSGSAEEALAALRSTMDEVEDAMSGIPKKSPPPSPTMPDGRMYPPLEDYITRNADGSITATTKGHRIEISADGRTRIINKKTGLIEFNN